jgi:hypothetical protein
MTLSSIRNPSVNLAYTLVQTSGRQLRKTFIGMEGGKEMVTMEGGITTTPSPLDFRHVIPSL